MDTYDMLMLGVLAAAVAFGAYKGLAWQVASISSIFASYYVAMRFREPVSQMIHATPPWDIFLAMLVLFIGCSLAIWTGFSFIKTMIDRVKLKEFDRQIGALLGFGKGVVLCVVITLFTVTLSGDETRQQIVRSKSGHYIAVLLAKTDDLIPPEAKQVIAPYVDEFNEQLRNAELETQRQQAEEQGLFRRRVW